MNQFDLSERDMNFLADVCEMWANREEEKIADWPDEDHELREDQIERARRMSRRFDQQLAPYTVFAFYLDTAQPYSQAVFAHSPKAAKRRAFEICCTENDFPTEGIDFEGDTILDLEDKVGLVIVAVIEGHVDIVY